MFFLSAGRVVGIANLLGEGREPEPTGMLVGAEVPRCGAGVCGVFRDMVPPCVVVIAWGGLYA